MVVIRSRPSNRTLLRKQISGVNKGIVKTNRTVAKFIQKQAKMLAPVGRTHKLVNSIDYQKISKTGYKVVVSAVSKSGFPYPLWVNQSKGYTTLHFPKGGPAGFGLKPGSTAVYGSTPGHWTWRGHPRFFRTATQRARRMFPDVAIGLINKGLRVNVK